MFDLLTAWTPLFATITGFLLATLGLYFKERLEMQRRSYQACFALQFFLSTLYNSLDGDPRDSSHIKIDLMYPYLDVYLSEPKLNLAFQETANVYLHWQCLEYLITGVRGELRDDAKKNMAKMVHDLSQLAFPLRLVFERERMTLAAK